MKNYFFFLVFLLILSSCSTLTQSQMGAVNQFGKTTEEFSAYPGKMMMELGNIRQKRGLFFASTISDPRLRITELDSIYSQKEYDYKVSQEIDITFRIIDKYAKSLILLSADEQSENIKFYAANFGVGLDSLVTLYNSIENTVKVPMGIGSAVNQLITSGGKQYIKHRQANEVRNIVAEADTLIAVMTTNLLEYIQSSNINELIIHEERMIGRDYLTFLQHTRENTFDSQRNYLEMKNSIQNTKNLQLQIAAATKDLRETHRQLLRIIQKRHSLEEVIIELQNFQQHVLAIRNTIQNIESAKS